MRSQVTVARSLHLFSLEGGGHGRRGFLINLIQTRHVDSHFDSTQQSMAFAPGASLRSSA